MNAVIQCIQALLVVLWAYIEALYHCFIPPPAKDVKDKVVLITGGSRGLGRGQALEFGRQGAKVAIWDINQAANEETAQEVSRVTGAQVRAYTCDVTSYDEVKKVANQVRADLGDVDILVNNAGILHAKNIIDLTEKEIRQTMEVNTMSHFWTIKEFLPAMMTKDEGHIVTICSMAGIGGSSLITDYCASKFAVFGLTEAVSEDLRHDGYHGIHTTTVCPLFVNTNLTQAIQGHASIILSWAGMYEPEDIGKRIVEGVLENRRYIYFPTHARMNRFFLGTMPVKARIAVQDLTAGRFAHKPKNQ